MASPANESPTLWLPQTKHSDETEAKMQLSHSLSLNS